MDSGCEADPTLKKEDTRRANCMSTQYHGRNWNFKQSKSQVATLQAKQKSGGHARFAAAASQPIRVIECSGHVLGSRPLEAAWRPATLTQAGSQT